MHSDPSSALLTRLMDTLEAIEIGSAASASRDLRETLVRRMAADVTQAWLHLASEATGAKSTFRTVTAGRAAMAAQGVVDDPLMQRLLPVAGQAVENAALHMDADLVSPARSRYLYALMASQVGIVAAVVARRFGDVAVEIKGQDVHKAAATLAAKLAPTVEAEILVPSSETPA